MKRPAADARFPIRVAQYHASRSHRKKIQRLKFGGTKYDFIDGHSIAGPMRERARWGTRRYLLDDPTQDRASRSREHRHAARENITRAHLAFFFEQAVVSANSSDTLEVLRMPKTLRETVLVLIAEVTSGRERRLFDLVEPLDLAFGQYVRCNSGTSVGCYGEGGPVFGTGQ